MTAFLLRGGRCPRRQASRDRVGTLAILAAATIALLLGAGMVPASAACNKAITVAETQQMNFGTIAVTSGGGTVTINTAGTVTAPIGFTPSGVTNAGSFHVTGTNGCNVTISFVAGSLTGPGTAMQIQNFTTDAGTTPVLTPAGGALNFNVGADLVVNAAQAGGSYSGTYTVTVIY